MRTHGFTIEGGPVRGPVLWLSVLHTQNWVGRIASRNCPGVFFTLRRCGWGRNDACSSEREPLGNIPLVPRWVDETRCINHVTANNCHLAQLDEISDCWLVAGSVQFQFYRKSVCTAEAVPGNASFISPGIGLVGVYNGDPCTALPKPAQRGFSFRLSLLSLGHVPEKTEQTFGCWNP